VRIVGSNLETGKAVTLGGHSTDVVNVSLRLPFKFGVKDKIKVEASVDYQVPKEPINRRAITLVHADAQVSPNLKIGYLPSFDETLEVSLKSLGVDARELSVAEVAKGELSEFTTIILDNRAYEAHRDLVPLNNRLLKYVEDGGTLLVFYHKTNEFRSQLAPYPITVGNDRVTEEDAPINILQPRHVLLNSPNRITQADFANWVQERGLYYPSQWDSHYTALLASHDKGEAPLNGGLLVAQHGKGNYIYTSMVWYRQLREGVPGGYRFFANLISYGKTRPEPGVSATP
jgi:hypothetical protein